MFTPLGTKNSLTQIIEYELTEAIRAGTYPPGSKLPTENELCDLFVVSRTAVREAIKKMNARGIVEVKRGSGVYVSEMSIKNASETLNLFFELSSDKNVILQTIKTRLVLEPALASQAATHRNDDQIELLVENIKMTKACDINDADREAELDNDFHKTILSIADNQVLDLLLGPMFNLMPKFKTSVFAKSQEGALVKKKEVMLSHHENILEAIIKQDQQLANKTMYNHILETQNNYIKTLKRK
ncbi:MULTISPECIES: FadR/GntR family transcriptional regulator [Winogradskyella]|uniref:FadR/GntR family transcriptional regulator n=1 Tax=Winogradskyella aquimaris TaxID=864074 RepID=A0ABU5ENS3_9FLAO|nr:FadR/GntR family transcriptional regulator [Winogradskyella aquimaris]MDY2587370.1 FadR/GntR family transcriptional regulator [Winogradskyella aquimaris]